jgi:hypothetical protein
MTLEPDPGMAIRVEIIETTNAIAVLQRDRRGYESKGMDDFIDRKVALLEARLAELHELYAVYLSGERRE